MPTDEEVRLRGKTLPLSDPSPKRLEQRRRDLKNRIALCREMGFRTVFHFGAPFVGDINISDAPPNCILDGKTEERCLVLLRQLAQEFPGIDDILVYTYDQHAWLCNEFGPCPNCRGIPLHDRVVPFLESLSKQWRSLSPNGLLWWEPWELSAGQFFGCLEVIDPKGFGLVLHSNIAEVMATHVVDRWLRNACAIAEERGIPVVIEHWLGAATEELEPCTHLAFPLLTLRALRSIFSLSGIAGIKEYYGLLPDRYDSSLEATSLFFGNPQITDQEALGILCRRFGEAGDLVAEFWKLGAAGMELFPWEGTWRFRRLATHGVAHTLEPAEILGVPWHTPSWSSTRRSIFMKVEDGASDPWMLEDIQLRCQMAANKWEKALQVGEVAAGLLPQSCKAEFESGLKELRMIQKVALRYALHLRETNVAYVMRAYMEDEGRIPEKCILEMQKLLQRDLKNQEGNKEIEEALLILRENPRGFLERYFRTSTNVPEKLQVIN